ncbi:hypothetical protein ElyMa_001486600 [Elysia marginata]|uniref:Smr domain-containing protein n=1 Tax=Elysia marginata TaxID=1093978 RepID=A0AAV4J679_9GAST|nr:hypothetical protein ElyMa_001486600 [Elysia marginata]
MPVSTTTRHRPDYSRPQPQPQPMRLYDGKDTIDLHGLPLKIALDATVDFVTEKREAYIFNSSRHDDRHIALITGQGLHSRDGVPVIRNSVETFLAENGDEYGCVKNNHGRLLVDLQRTMLEPMQI